MKSRISNNLDGASDMGTYFEMPLSKFLIQMPQYAESILASGIINVKDTNYIVRFRFTKKRKLDLEIGYPEDTEWRIGQPDDSKELSYPIEEKEIISLLDERISQGSSFVVIPMKRYLEMHSGVEDLFKNFDIEKSSMCFFYNERKELKNIIGNNTFTDEEWKECISAFWNNNDM